MKFIQKIFSEKEFPLTAMRFYAVGIILFIIPASRDLFLLITPWILLVNLIVILFFHKTWDIKSFFVFLFIIIASILLEMKGVSDERVFGNYQYLSTLGIKVKETPLLIGVNWLMLVYGSHAIVAKRIKNSLLRILLASSLMIVYDLIIEIVAPTFRMWDFGQPYPPLQNFIMWFLASSFFLSLFELLKINTSNKYARSLFLIQIGFFSIISIYILIFIH